MISFFQKLFDTSDFPPRWNCGVWTEGHGWLHILSDLAIFGAYAAIPMALAYFIWRRKDVPFIPIFWLFAAFIISCGLSHLVEATIFWHPWYRLSGVIKAVTATVSWITVFALLKTLPSALALPGLAAVNRQLNEEIAERKQAEAELRQSEASYRMLFEAPGVGRAEADVVSSRFLRVNPFYCELLGFTEEELLSGQTFVDVTHPDDRETNGRQLKPLISGARESVYLEQRYVRKDGSPLWVSASVSVLPDTGGEPQRLVATVHDITARKRTEERLRLFESAIQKMNDVVLITEAEPIDLPGPRIVYVNPAFARMTGYSAEEVVGKTPRILQGPKTDRAELDLIRTNLEAREPVKVELTNYRKDGSEFEVEFEIVPVADDHGCCTHLVSVQRDVTDRKQMEVALRQNAALFSEIIDQAPGGVFVVDAGFRVLQVNDGAMPVFANVRPLIGRDFEQVLKILWGPDVGQQCSDIFRHTLATGERYVSPRFTERRHDIDEQQSYEWETQHITLPDGQQGVVCYFEDVTERIDAEEARRANEQRMRLATEATQVGIWEWNVITGEVRWDAQMFRIYGMAPKPEGTLQYRDWRDAVLPEDLPENEAILQETVRTCGQSSREFRIRRRDDGECRCIHCVETVRTDAEGEAEWVVGTNLDITERKRAERAILDEAKRKDEFLAMLGHELRNPLNAIRHAVEISNESPADTEARQWADRVIDRQSQQLSRMVEDLLDVARLNRGRIELRLEALDFGTVLDRALAAARPLVDGRRHRLEVKIDDALAVNGDAARLEQVFVNLLTNAAKYTPEGGLLSIRAKRDDGELVVSVKDNGVGISPELLPHIFDLFRQADSTLDRAQGGLGIGMNVVKSLVEMHRGEVTVASDGPNTGTTVTVRLPLLKDGRVEVPSAPEPPAPSQSAPRETRVLIVDDHEDAANGLARLLRRRGCEIRLAHTGPDGLSAAREFKPEVLLLDLGLPGFDGYELIRQLRAEADFDGALFIAISGYAQSGDRERCLAAGFDEHIAKPIDVPALLEAIRSHRGG